MFGELYFRLNVGGAPPGQTGVPLYESTCSVYNLIHIWNSSYIHLTIYSYSYLYSKLYSIILIIIIMKTIIAINKDNDER